MAITAAHLTSARDTNNASSYTTASVQMQQDKLILLWFANEGTPDAVNSVASSSVTFTQIGSDVNEGGCKFTLWGAIPASTVTETITITLSATDANAAWSVVEIDGADTSGTVANAIVQSVPGSSGVQVTSASITLSAFAGSANRAFAGFYLLQRNETLVAGTDFAIIGQAGGATEPSTIGTEWRSDAEDTQPDITWSTGSTWTGIAVEVAESAGAALAPVDATLNAAGVVANTAGGGTDDITIAATITGPFAVCVHTNNNGDPAVDVSGVSWSLGGGEALTKIADIAGGVSDTLATEVWWINAPTEGAGTLTVSLSGAPASGGEAYILDLNDEAAGGLQAGNVDTDETDTPGTATGHSAVSYTQPAVMIQAALLGDTVSSVAGQTGQEALVNTAEAAGGLELVCMKEAYETGTSDTANLSWTNSRVFTSAVVTFEQLTLNAPSTPTLLASEPLLSLDNVGAVTLTWAHDENFSSFLVQSTMDGGTNWVPVAQPPAGARTATLSGLNTSLTWGFRIAAVGDEIHQTGQSSFTSSVGLGSEDFSTTEVYELARAEVLNSNTLSFAASLDADDDTLLIFMGMEGTPTLPTLSAATWTASGQSAQNVLAEQSGSSPNGLLRSYMLALSNPNPGSGTLQLQLTGAPARFFAQAYAVRSLTTLISVGEDSGSTGTQTAHSAEDVSLGNLVFTWTLVEPAVTGLLVTRGSEVMLGYDGDEGTARWLGVHYARSSGTFTPSHAWNETDEFVSIVSVFSTGDVVSLAVPAPSQTLELAGFAPSIAVTPGGGGPSLVWTDIPVTPADIWTDVPLD